MRCIPAAVLLAASICVAEQNTPANTGSQDLRQHYDAAQTAQAGGNLDGAAAEYSQFLVKALRRLADHRAKVQEFSKSDGIVWRGSLLESR